MDRWIYYDNESGEIIGDEQSKAIAIESATEAMKDGGYKQIHIACVAAIVTLNVEIWHC